MSEQERISVGVFPADLEGCGHYRLIWPAFQLRESSSILDVTVVPPNARDGMFSAEIVNDEVVKVQAPLFDVMVFQRVTHKYLAQAIKLLVDNGRRIIIDIDDDLSAIHPSNPAFTVLHPKKMPNQMTADHGWQWCEYACQYASLVTVSSSALAYRYGKHGRVKILRNAIPAHYLDIETQHAPKTFGWGGSLHSHADDVPQLGVSVSRLQNLGYDFKVIGPGIGVKKALNLYKDPVVSGIVELGGWPEALSTLSVGLAPLNNTKFNAAKSWLKPLEYASVGVPVVMSPRAEYKEIYFQHGIGEMASKPAEWFKKVKRLLDDDDYRMMRGEVARGAARKLTLQAKGHEWEEAWNLAAPRPKTIIHSSEALGAPHAS